MRKIISLIRMVVLIIICSILTVYYSFRAMIAAGKPNASDEFHKLYKIWSAKLIRLFGIKIIISGHENLKKDEDYIYIANHSSLFDIPIVLASIKDSIRIMYKTDLEKIPIFGPMLRKSPFIAVDRSNPRQAMSSIEEAVKIIRQNSSVLVFPEGTRSEGGKLGSFKRGAFMLASKAGKPIVPLTIIGAWNIMPARTFIINKGTVELIIGKPYYYEGELDRQSEKEIMGNMQELIKNNLGQ